MTAVNFSMLVCGSGGYFVPDVKGGRGDVPGRENRNKMHIQTNVYFFTISSFSKEDIENAKYISATVCYAAQILQAKQNLHLSK